MRINERQVFFVAAILLVSQLMGCDSSSVDHLEGTAFDYSPPTSEQLMEIQALWRSRDLSASKVVVVHQDDSHATYQLRIYEHTVQGRRHYGAVTIPKSDSAQVFPVVLFADGLDQSNPTMDVGRWSQAAQYRLGQAIFAVPIFRGRTLIYNGLSFTADGDFCDAYDGATDDAIALLNVVEDQVREADFSRLMVRGGSRGGNIALLLAERDERVTVAASASAPTDFYREAVAAQYGTQYRCQFITGKTPTESRQRMLSSSPLHFSVLPGVVKVYIDHGEQDPVVPLWNGAEMAAKLRTQQVQLQYRTYPGLGHDLGGSPEFQAVQAKIYEDFLSQ
ncbi:MAG: alpha/beta hydrolase family protein [Povalibacter sp.]